MLPTPEDHVAITQLLARYCIALDHDDIDAWVALFTPDATFEVFGRSFDGEVGLRTMMSGAPRGLHLGGSAVIEMLDANRAVTQQNLLLIDRVDGAARGVVYIDDLRRTGDGWRIANRRCQFIVADGLSDRPGV